jgi:hypothetical protein
VCRTACIMRAGVSRAFLLEASGTLTRIAFLLSLAMWLCQSGAIAGGTRLNLIYTGGTRSTLEAAMDHGASTGGLARRATIIRSLSRGHPNALLLDAGGLFSGDTTLDRARCGLHLQVMRDLGYQAVGAGPDELRHGRAFPDSVTGAGGPVLLSCNLWDSVRTGTFFEPFRVYEVKGLRVGIVGISGGGDVRGRQGVLVDSEVAAVGAVASLEPRTDLIVLLSGLTADANRTLAERIPAIDVILALESDRAVRRIGSTTILGAATGGGWVGRATVSVGLSGVEVTVQERIEVTAEIAQDAAVLDTLDAFYDRVVARSGGAPGTPPVGPGRFVGAETCATCHSEAYKAWAQTGHAQAFEALLADQAHFHPECLPCHTTGYSQIGGYGPGNREADLASVGCEACHGPGRVHVQRPDRRNIGTESGRETCLGCHTAQQSPDFLTRSAHDLDLAVHGRPATVEDRRNEGTAGRGPVRVELFVMPECPYGIQAESVLIPVIQRLGSTVDFDLRYIAEPTAGSGQKPSGRREGRGLAPSCEGDPIPGSGRFQSLHGDEEVAEGVRQVAMAAYEPQRYLDYVLCRGRSDAARSWEDCAAEVGIDPVRIAAISESPEGEALYAENILRSNLLGVRASPTLFIDGKESMAFHDAVAFQRALCGEDTGSPDCASLPACTADRDCARPGMVGLCRDPGKPHARCIYREPVSYEMVVVNDPACRVCDTGFFIRSTVDLFPGVQIRNVDATSDEGKSLIARYGLDAVPAFILGEGFAQAARYPRFARTATRKGDAYLPRPEMVPVRRLLGKPSADGRIDLFMDPESAQSMQVAGRLVSWVVSNGLEDSLSVYYAPGTTASRAARTLVCVRELDPSRFLDFLTCRVRGTVGGRRDLTTEACLEALGLDPAKVLRCADGARVDSLLQSDARATDALGFGVRHGSLVVLDGRVVVSAQMASRAPELYRRLHPVAVPDDDLSGD